MGQVWQCDDCGASTQDPKIAGDHEREHNDGELAIPQAGEPLHGRHRRVSMIQSVKRVKLRLEVSGQVVEIDRALSASTRWGGVTDEAVISFARELTDLALHSLGYREPHEPEWSWMTLDEAQEAVAGDAYDVYKAVGAGRLEITKGADGTPRFRFLKRTP